MVGRYFFGNPAVVLLGHLFADFIWAEADGAGPILTRVDRRRGSEGGSLRRIDCERFSSSSSDSGVIRLQRIHNFLCSMLVFTPFA
jgi:hypothetical protein